ncbi:4334_t:CDS:10, partial [Cetraspora pellucida]
YENEEDVIIWVNTVGPKSNRQETYEYFQLPYCQGDHVSEHHHETLGEALLGKHGIGEFWNWHEVFGLFKNNIFALHEKYSEALLYFLVKVENVTICDKGLTAKDVNLFRYAVSNNYWYQLFLDELPVWGFVGELDANTGDAFLYTHRDFVISYNNDKIIQVRLESGNPVKLFWETRDIPIRFSYSVTWEPTEDSFDSRFDKLLDTEFFEHKIHWFSIFNSFLMVMLLAGFVSVILLRMLKKDYARYDKEEALGDLDHDLGDEYGWKQVHGDVFRAPRSLLLFSALVGYSSANTYQIYGGRNWIKNILVTATLWPGILSIMTAMINFVAVYYSSSRAIPFTAMLAIFATWLFLSFPLAFLGAILCRNWASQPNFPCRVNPIPRPIPEKIWYAEPLVIVALGGVLPFAHWMSFLTCGSTAVYVYLYAIYYFINRTKMYGLFQTTFYFGNTAIICADDEVLDDILELFGDEENERLSNLQPEPSASNTYAHEEKRPTRTSSQKRKSTTPPRRGGYSEEDGEGNERRRDTDEFDSELYHDEDDRDRLENLVELDRERILAERAEKIQHHKDLEAVQLMINLEDVSSTRRSSRTKDTKKKGIEELKRRRAQKNQRTKAGSLSPEPGEHVTTGDEDDVFYEDYERGEQNKDDDSDGITVDDIRDIQLTRHQFSDWVYKPFFEKIVTGCFVRLHIGLQNGKQIYRVCEIVGVEVPERVQPYLIDANDKVKTNKVLRLKHADAVKSWQMNIISNGKFEQSEFDRWTVTMKIKKLDLPTKEAITKKKEQIKAADDYILSEQDVDIMIKQKQTLRGGVEPVNLLTEKTNLVTQKNLAVAQGNKTDAQNYATRLAEIDRMISETSRSPKQDSKSIKASINDSPTSKTNGDRTEQFEKAKRSSLTRYEAMINDVQIDLLLPPDPEYEKMRDQTEEYYEARYSEFNVEHSLELIRKIVKQSSQTQQQPDVPQQQQPQLPPREESKSIQHYTAQPPHSSWNSDSAIPSLKDLHYEI